MKVFSLHTLVAFLSSAILTDAYRILGIFPFSAVSHNRMSDRLMEELALRGHQVDVISHYPMKKPIPNYNHIINLSGIFPSLLNNMTYAFGTEHLGKNSLVYAIANEYGGDLCHIMDLPRFRELIRNPPKDPPYDLLIISIFGSNCYLALGQHLKIPVVGVVTSPMWPWANDMVANPDNPAYIPHVFSGLSSNMNFWQRMKNTVTMAIKKFEFKSYTAYQEDLIKKYIGPNAPSLRDAEKNISLILVNSHHSLQGVRPFTKAVVEVGGLHIKERETQLPDELKKWLDDSTDGFVFISFGSMLRIESYPKKTIIAMYASLAKLAPTRVVMRIANESELPPNLPSNVLTLPWIPQIGVLHHRNIRAFMTHGGLMGTQEAVYFGVPMIGVPLFGDQILNLEIYVRKNMAVVLSHNELTEKNLDAAFNAVLRDPSYTIAAKKVSAEFRDRPMTAVDTAIFWVEYVIRHGGTNLRSPAMDLTWWQVALLDVHAALLLFIVLALYLLKIAVIRPISSIMKSGSKISLLSKKNE